MSKDTKAQQAIEETEKKPTDGQEHPPDAIATSKHSGYEVLAE